MFSTKCPQCNNKVKKSFEFCPHCGEDLKSKFDKQDYGFLGRNDSEGEPEVTTFTDAIMDKMFSSAMKVLQKQMKNIAKDIQNQHRHPKQNPQIKNHPLNVQFFVNGKKVFPEKQQKQMHQKRQNYKHTPQISKERLKHVSKLPRVKPKSKMKRLSNNMIIYELHVPGVNNITDILINQLESSIEVKAISDKKVYTKTLEVNLPLIRYGIFKDNLILEFQGH